MAKGDEDKTAFFLGEGVCCYVKMPFGLKNAGATYQRLVDKVFSKQIGRNLEAYGDDMFIKSTSEEGMLSDIQETFERFRSINMKLNPKKCSFGVEEGLFLGHLITKQGIKVNPLKIKAVTELEQPRALKDIQSLNGKLASLSRFLSKGAERSLPFFKILKSSPRAGETLIMYLAASKESINAALFAKISEGHIPFYFVSRVLQGAELNYLVLEKLILALVHAARRLRRYFQAHTIMVLTGMSIKQALTEPEKIGRVAKWAIELGEHDIVFLKKDERETPADFLPEIPFDDSEKKVKEKEVSYPSNEWKLYTDRASSSDGSGAGLMLIGPAGNGNHESSDIPRLTTSGKPNKGTYAAKQLSIKSYLQKVKTALKGFEGYTFEHVRRNQNKKADALSKLASMTFEHLTKEVLVEVLAKRSIEEKEVLKVEIKEKRSWMSPIQEYLLSGLLSKDTKEARKIRIQVPQYKLIRDNLYKRSFFTPWLCCIAPPQTNKIIKEIHEGSCGFNTEPHSMVVRITKQGVDGAIAVGIEHSTKWMEAKPITVKNARHVEKFVWEYAVCRFGVPQMISSKEEKYFKEGIFADFCKGLKITQSFSPITEHMEIMHYIEKQLVRRQQSWVDNLAKELWVHRTLPRNIQEETPFSLTYGSEAVVPIAKATDDRGRTQETTKKGKEIAC
ncbi:reverse transcriptase domain-containing protein [Tanacetum coccineum]|uniref:Reverse transcriptase domain-containing protein n=1 Tax=Tanacetum coccineum TaxID=301880 RepID=A0ABQ4WBM5_9ASTR